MKKKILIGLGSIFALFIIIIIIAVASGPSEPSPTSIPTPEPVAPTPAPITAPTPTPAPTQIKLEPIVIKEWTGISNKTTESFDISKKPWVIAWSFSPNKDSSFDYFKIEIMDAHTNYSIALPANKANATYAWSDQSYIHEIGRFYLDIASLQGTWHIKVAELKPVSP